MGSSAESIAGAHNVSIPAVYMTAISLILSGVSRNPQVVLTVDSANRSGSNVRNSVGCYARHAFLPVDVDGNPDFSVNMYATYCEAGGSSRYAVAIVRDLAAEGFVGVSPQDFLSTVPLADLAFMLHGRDHDE